MKVILTVFLLAFLLLSCSEKNYTWVPTTQKPTYFEKQHDCEFSFSGSQIGELHGAYAITNNLALSLTGAWGAAGRDTNSFPIFDSTFTEIGRTHIKPQVQDIDFALGYFKRLNDNWQFELFGGMSIVSQSMEETITIYDTGEETKGEVESWNLYNKYYLQPAIGKNHRNYDFGFVGRISVIDYNISNTDFMFEPSVFVRFGYRNLKAMAQMGVRLNTHNGTNDYYSSPLNFGLGLYYVINDSVRKERNN